MLFLDFFLIILIGSFSFCSRIEEFSNSEKSWEKFNQALLPFLNEQVSEVVTFGSNCLPKFRVISFCSNKTIPKRFINYNHLFDWMVPLNYTLLGLAAENNFTDVFGEEFLTITRFNNVNALYNAKYKLIFNHAFDGYSVMFQNNSKSLLNEELFHKYYYLIDDKFKYLTRKSQEAIHSDKKTMYLIFGDVTHSDPKSQRQEDFIAYTNSIKKQRNNNFIVLVLISDKLDAINNYSFDTIIEGNLIFHKIKSYPSVKWALEDSIAQWNKILKVFA
jgi:hypothetical protein